ncbi:MAG: GDP-mannose 4,6-dehydratase [Mobilitalea sp.]
MDERILITGCNGFVAKYLAEYLKKKGNIVYGIDLQDVPNLDFIAYNKIDICDIEKIKELITKQQITQVYHLAAIADPRVANQNPTIAININVKGSLSFFELCKDRSNTSVLVTGSATEYQLNASDHIICSENEVLEATTIYGATKIAAEAIGQAYVKNYRANVKFTRSSNHTGPGQSTSYVLSNFAKQCADIAKNIQSPEIFVGNIDIYRDFLDVEDVVSAYFIIMQKGKQGEVYNVSSNSSYLIRDLLNQLVSFTGRKDIKIKVDGSRIRACEPKNVHCDSSKLYRDTGWQPKIPIRTTLRNLYNYWYEK